MFNNKSILLIIALAMSNLAHADLTTGLVAYYPFNGNANDASGNGNNGTVNGGLTYASGKIAQAAKFDGVDDFVQITPQSTINAIGDFSISVWTNLTDFKSQPAYPNRLDRQYVFDAHTHSSTVTNDFYRQGFYVIYDGNSNTQEIHDGIMYNTTNDYLEQNTSFAVKGLWLHHVFIRNGSNDYTYINGELIDSTYFVDNKKDTVLDMQHDWFIGTFSGNNPYYMNGTFNYSFYGLLDEMRIYNRALTAADIQELYQEGTTKQLTITKTGTGNGSVTSNPAGIDCATQVCAAVYPPPAGCQCTAAFSINTNVTLTATTAANSIFNGFSGDADCTDKSVTMNADKTCIATFTSKPIAVTNPANNITQTSATLNGNVISTGATATTSFDFGTTATYDISVAATPSSVYSSTAVAVTANKTDLICGTTYHYRVKAVNSAGTGYGANQTFTSVACPPPTVNSWLSPPNKNVLRDRSFTLGVTANSDSMQIAAYEFIVTFDSNKLTLDQSLCNKGVCKGSYGLPTNQVVINTANSAANTIKITGLSNAGEETGPGNDLQLLIVNFKSRTTLGSTPVNLTTNKLDNSSGDSIGTTSRGTTVNVKTGICGDSDGNTVVNIVDALSIARTLVKLPPPPTVNDWLADVDQNDTLSIVDALHLARYSVGLVLTPGVCAIGQAL